MCKQELTNLGKSDIQCLVLWKPVWTIYRLAQESKLSQTTISNIFKRNNQPSLPTVNAICDACGITLAQFFTENDTADSPNAKSELDNSVAALKEDQREALAAFIKTIV